MFCMPPPTHAKKTLFPFSFFPTELKVFLYNLSFKVLSEVYTPELADTQSVEFTKLSKEVNKLVCRYYYPIIVPECVQNSASESGREGEKVPFPGGGYILSTKGGAPHFALTPAKHHGKLSSRENLAMTCAREVNFTNLLIFDL